MKVNNYEIKPFANLRDANLGFADLRGANLRGANLGDANLRGANLYGAESVPFIPQLEILAEGDIIGYKKCREGIVKLLIPKEAKRSSGTGRKCRAEYAKVIEIIGTKRQTATSFHDHFFIYRIGATVKPTEPFSDNRWKECSSGIHFFITRQEAEDY